MDELLDKINKNVIVDSIHKLMTKNAITFMKLCSTDTIHQINTFNYLSTVIDIIVKTLKKSHIYALKPTCLLNELEGEIAYRAYVLICANVIANHTYEHGNRK